MVLFIGTDTEGCFIEEVIKTFNKGDIQYTGAVTLDAVQYEAMREKWDVVIIDVDALQEPTGKIVNVVEAVHAALHGDLIIYAKGYQPTSDLVLNCAAIGITYFLLSPSISDLREELSSAFRGIPTELGIDREMLKKQKQDDNPMQPPSRSIAVAGSLNRIGTTTLCLQIIKYLQQMGKRACYVEMNSNEYIDCLSEFYVDYTVDPNAGYLTCEKIDFYSMQQIPAAMKNGYEYIIYDFGSVTDANFNLAAYLDKMKRIIVCGSKPPELKAMTSILASPYFTDITFFFNFIPESEQPDVLEQMEDQASNVLFAKYTPDPFFCSSQHTALYERLLLIPTQDMQINGNKKKKAKKSLWHRRGK